MMNSFKKAFKSYLPVFLSILALILLLKFVIQISIVPSNSMEPTISENTLIIGSKLSSPSKNDIIIFKKEGVNLVKRIIATGGETVVIKNGHYYVDGKKEKKGNTFAYKETKFAVPRGCFFVSGDNREHSNDSRYWANPFVKKEEVISKVIFKGW